MTSASVASTETTSVTSTKTAAAATTPTAISTTPTTAVVASPSKAQVKGVISIAPVAEVVRIPVIVIRITGIRTVVGWAGFLTLGVRIGNEVGPGFKGIKFEGTDVRAVEDDCVVLLYFDWLGLSVGTGIGVRLTLQNADGVGVGVERIEAIFNQIGLASGQVDEDLGVLDGAVNAYVGDSTLDSQFRVFIG